MAKRANSEGSIYKRSSDGRYVGSLTWKEPATGKRHRTTYYGRTRAEVREKLNKALERRRDEVPVRDTSMTVGAWAQIWLDTTVAASSRKSTTKQLYGYLVKSHIAPPPFGSRRLDRLRPSHIDELVMQLRRKTKAQRSETGDRVQVRALADSTIQRVFSVVRLLLDGAVRDGLIAKNPAAVVRPPAIPHREARFLSTAEVRRLLEAASVSRYCRVFTFIAATGVREGEALALSWSDVDFDAGLIRIAGTLTRVEGRLEVMSPKTLRSRRVLPLTPAVAAVLRSQLDAQAREQEIAQNLWRRSDFVFTTEVGAPMQARNVLRALTMAAAKAELIGVSVHTLHHSAATALLEAGVHLKAVSELLGHATIRITGDVYGHVSPEVARAAMDSLSESLELPTD